MLEIEFKVKKEVTTGEVELGQVYKEGDNDMYVIIGSHDGVAERFLCLYENYTIEDWHKPTILEHTLIATKSKITLEY